ncbi:MAG: trigger factor [candidate division NC10 bacterium]|nr:trigger factor [candidate division NC10 bacterium]
MKVTVEELSPSKRALHVELPPERVAATMEATLRELGRKIQVPGFRRGRVPPAIIQRRFQSDLQEEVLRELIPDSYRQALAQTDLTPVGQPRVDDVHFHAGEPLRYRAVVEVKPPVEVTNYRGIGLERKSVEVTDQEVDRALEYLREDAAEYVPMEGWPALRDDLIILDHEGTIHGKPFKGGSGKNLTLLVGRGGHLPGFEEQVLGMQKGEAKQFRLPFPEDFPRKELAGRAAEFKVTVKEVKKRRVPELNDEFARTVGDVDSLAALRDKLRDQLKARKTRDQEAELKHALLEKLAAAHEVEAPESLVEVEASSLLREMLGAVRASGGRVEGLPENAEGLTAKALEVARRRVKESLLLEAVARQESLTVSQEETEAEIQAIAAAYRQEPTAVRRALEDPDRRAGLTARLLERKALDFLYQHARITDAFNLITPG